MDVEKKAFEVNFSSFLKGGKSNETPDLSPSSSGIHFSKNSKCHALCC